MDFNLAAPNWMWLGALHHRSRGQDFMENMKAKQGHYLIGHSLSSCIIWESPHGYLQLVVLQFLFLIFLDLSALTVV